MTTQAEPDELVTKKFRLPRSLAERLEHESEERLVSQNMIMRRALEDLFEHLDG